MKLPLINSKKMIKILQGQGYKVIGQTGSHVQFKGLDGVIVTVPVHPGKKLKRSLLRKIIRDMGLSREEFIRLSEKVR